MAKKRKQAKKKASVLWTYEKKIRKQWSEELMMRALEEAAKGKLPISRISVKYKLPCTMLKNRIKSRVKHETNPGPSPYLKMKKSTRPTILYLLQN